jgi:hypothetical protein
VGVEDLLVGDRVDPAAGVVAGRDGLRHEAGLPIRIAVAIVSGSSTGWPRTIGAAPAAWKPHIRGVRRHGAKPRREPRAVSRGILLVALPVGGDVAGVADRQAVDVRGVAEGVDDLEGRRLLPLDAGGVDRVDQLDRVGLGELASHGETVVEVARHLQQRGPVGDRLAELAHRDLAVGHQHGAGHPGLGGIGGRACARVAGGGADDDLSRRGGHRDGRRHPAVLERPGRVEALKLQPHLRADALGEVCSRG